MSHFLCLVVLPAGTTLENAEDEAARLLQLYDENESSYGRWDWWVIGGRWDGWIFGPEREKESSDQKGGFNFGEQHQHIANNCRPVAEIPLDDSHYVPLTLVTPDGEWQEMGRVGWFAQISNAMKEDVWEKHFREEMAKYPGHLAITIDCHV